MIGVSAGQTRERKWAWSSMIRRPIIVWLAASAVGGTVIALPDTGPRLFSFSESHGPSVIDLIGMAVLVAGWLPVAWLLWSRRAAIRGRSAWLAGLLAIAGVVLLVLTVGKDLGAWWLAAAAILVTAQFVALRSIADHEGTSTAGPTHS